MSCYRKAIAVNYRRQFVHVFPSGSQVFEHFVEYQDTPTTITTTHNCTKKIMQL